MNGWDEDTTHTGENSLADLQELQETLRKIAFPANVLILEDLNKLSEEQWTALGRLTEKPGAELLLIREEAEGYPDNLWEDMRAAMEKMGRNFPPLRDSLIVGSEMFSLYQDVKNGKVHLPMSRPTPRRYRAGSGWSPLRNSFPNIRYKYPHKRKGRAVKPIAARSTKPGTF